MHISIPILLASFLASPLVSTFLHAQVSLEMTPIEAEGTITEVTLYRNRAAITRTTTLNLAAGGYSVFFRDLPNSIFISSVQASAGENASLLSVDTSNKPIAKDNRRVLAKIDEEIAEVQSKIDAEHAKEGAIMLQMQMLKTLIDQAGASKEATVDLESLDQQLDFIGSKMSKLISDQIEDETELRDLGKQLIALKSRKQNISHENTNQIDAVVDIGVKTASTVEVTLTYLVNYASWKPVYSIRSNAQGNEIVIDYDAELSQRTGENWVDIALTLSTAQPQQSITPPMPTPWYVDLYAQDKGPSAPSSRNRTNYTMDTMSDGVYGNSYRGDMLVELAAEVGAASASAAVVGDGPAVSFVLPRTVTVPSNAEDKQTTSLASIETTAELFRVAVPMLTDRVFIQSNVTNESEYILLPGQASIFHGSDYVGKTTLASISPNETFFLNLGVDPSVLSTRTLVQKNTTSTGLFSSGKQTMYEYQITISNGHDEPIDLRLWDRIPVSRNEEIEITLKDISIALSTDSAYLESERLLGLLRWDVTIGANMTGEQTYTLNWGVEVARGNDIEMTRLPE